MRNITVNAITIFIISLVLSLLFILAISDSISAHIDNQDIMLCNSAKVSGNEEYLNKCQCFYTGQPIACIQKEVNKNDK